MTKEDIDAAWQKAIVESEAAWSPYLTARDAFEEADRNHKNAYQLYRANEMSEDTYAPYWKTRMDCLLAYDAASCKYYNAMAAEKKWLRKAARATFGF